MSEGSIHLRRTNINNERALRIFRKHGGMMRTGQAIRVGIHPRTLYALRDKGEIEQLGRGLFRLSSAQPLRNPDLVPIAIRIPRAVVCLISALAHHGLTTQIPHAIDIALPSHAKVPKVDGVPLRVFWYPESSFRAEARIRKMLATAARRFVRDALAPGIDGVWSLGETKWRRVRAW